MPLGDRSSTVLAVIAAEPGLSNREVAEAAGVSDEGQISRLLAHLKSLGLIRNRGKWCPGQPHSWQLTTRGKRAAQASTLSEPALRT